MTFLCKTNVHVFNFSFFCTLFSLFLLCNAADSIRKGQSIQDGDTLISENEHFELGFFSPGNSELRYLGIWYYEIQNTAVIWVANRERPISDKNGVLTIDEDGNLVVRDGNGSSVWSSNTANFSSSNTTAILRGTGDLVLSSAADTNKAYWESFNHPTDTFLPHMKVVVDSAAGENHCFRSWKSVNDPSPGNFTMGVDPRGAPQIVVWENSRRRWRSGHWNGQIFTGVPSMITLTNYLYGFKFNPAEGGRQYFTYNPSNASDLLRFKILWNGTEEQLKWNGSERKWDVMQSQPNNDCELYNYCGNFGVCRALDSSKCSCMEGYEPTYPDQWRNGNWSGGCKRRSALKCQMNTNTTAQDGFKAVSNLKLPDFATVTEASVTLDSCKEKCLNNCSCNAYAKINGIGCMTWTGDMIDMQEFDRDGNTLFLRLAASEFGGRRLSTAVIVIIVVAALIFLAIVIYLLWRYGKKHKALPKVTSVSLLRMNEIPLSISNISKSGENSTDLSGPADLVIGGSQVNGPDLPLFNFSCVASAVNNFSDENKLGKGGFGSVYKGKLPGGEEIAVKRLSRISGQGLEEFKNEIKLIAKLQHRNLVRLLGCCIQGEEKMLLYEYMANKSLDYFLFDPTRQGLLDWTKRFAIIEGIARGLLYLHRDSRLRIIHRDLKASNILLDEDMNPKISDFGMARIFGGNQNEANTNRVVGTYGYMSPEYAMEGLFSVKSDVYSFGVLVMEIISGRRNTSFRMTDHVLLVAYAWQLWTEGNAMELVDPSIRDSCRQEQVLWCIQLAMLCVQDSATHRPTMAHVLLMLESDPPLPLPRQPTFTSMRASTDTELYIDSQDIVSSNDLTDTMVVGR